VCSSYKPEVFARTVTAIRRYNIMTSEHTSQFERVLERVAVVAAQRKATDEELGDAPDQFIDAIMGARMMYAPRSLCCSALSAAAAAAACVLMRCDV
jgi:hypothetical protein